MTNTLLHRNLIHMFTGIVQYLGTVTASEPVSIGRRLTIDLAGWDHQPHPGESIAVDGCCLTVVDQAGENDGSIAAFDVIPQTLVLTPLGDLVVSDRVNLEHAVTPTTLLGGHVMQGHIDGVGVVEQITRSEDEWRVRISPPIELMECIIERGSIAINGVSLTLAQVDQTWFEVALIPTTLNVTNLGGLQNGNRVNIETDYLARTVIAWVKRYGGGHEISPP